ncbi:hypothetical protein C3E97_016955 [Pseudomonas sp. MWU12-2115]|nr:hypothetical protein C3E97_016955 [Pseudomonas sp. MWU12-2115]
MNRLVVARELAPAGARSDPNIPGLLRSPAGASSLATSPGSSENQRTIPEINPLTTGLACLTNSEKSPAH